VLAHRIGSKRFCGTALDAFSGRGSLHGHGRWHHRGRLAVYVASHESLALLEILVHLNRKTDLQPMVHWKSLMKLSRMSPSSLLTGPGIRNIPGNWATAGWLPDAPPHYEFPALLSDPNTISS